MILSFSICLSVYLFSPLVWRAVVAQLLTSLVSILPRGMWLHFSCVYLYLCVFLGEESYNPDGLLPRAIMALKEAYPDILVLADVALDPYSTAGQDGVVDEETGKVLNDITVHQLCKQVS